MPPEDSPHPGLDSFWDCLKASNAVAPQLLAEIRASWTPDSWRPLGEILMRNGSLGLSQVARLIGMQSLEPHMRIGDLAVREGLCSAEQVEAALQMQREACPGPVEILLRDKHLNGEGLLDALLMYARYLEGRLLSRGVADDVNPEC